MAVYCSSSQLDYHSTLKMLNAIAKSVTQFWPIYVTQILTEQNNCVENEEGYVMGLRSKGGVTQTYALDVYKRQTLCYTENMSTK